MLCLGLQQNGKSVKVLEARSRLGGRMYGTTAGNDTAWMDHGGQWVGPTQYKMLDLLQEFRIKTFDYAHGYTRMEYNGKHDDYKGDMYFAMLPDDKAGESPTGIASPDEIEVARQAWSKIEEIIGGFNEGDRPFDHKDAMRLDSITMYSWLQDNTKTDYAKFFFKTAAATLGPIGQGHVSTISILHFAWSQFMSPQSEMPESFLIHGGAGQVPGILAEEIGHHNVELNQDVVHVSRKNGMVHAKTSQGKRFHSQALIMAVPPAVASGVVYDPPLSAQRNQLMQRFPMGTIAKILVAYPEKYWYQNDVVMCVSDNAKYVEFTADASDPTKTTGVVAAFIQGSNYFEWAKLSEKDQKGAVLADLEHLYGKSEMLNATEVVVADWPRDQYSGGGYAGAVPPGVWTQYGPGLLNTEWDGYLDFAGTEYATKWAGFFEGAALSADAVVERVMLLK